MAINKSKFTYMILIYIYNMGVVYLTKKNRDVTLKAILI